MMVMFMGMFVVVMFFLPSGLNLYILVSGLIGLLQSYLVHKKRKNRGEIKTGDSDDNEQGEKDVSMAGASRAARKRQARKQSS